MTARKARISRRLRDRVANSAGHACGYCRTPEVIAGFRLNIEHILPEAKGGKTVEENLWLACHSCNEFKSWRTARTGSADKSWASNLRPHEARLSAGV